MSLSALLADPAEARRALRAGEAGPVELARAALDRAETLQPVIGAFAALTPELALEQACRAERELRSGRDRGPLHGLPLAVKDVFDVAGVPTRLGTPGAGHRVPAKSAGAVDAIVEAGAVVIGKAATHELALGMVTPQSRNPVDPSRMTGGSSGGSAAAVAAGIVSAALGTDTNGSVRCPAALCGVVGLKPTIGSISREGVSPLAWSQDTVGVLARSAADCAVTLAALAPVRPTPSSSALLRVGVDRAACAAAEPAVERAVVAALVDAAGLELVDVSSPDLGLVGSASVIVILAEAATAWGHELAARPAGFGPRVRAALRAGRKLPASAYLDAKRVRAQACARLRTLFDRQRLDALALPAVPVTAAPVEAERIPLHGRERAVESLHSMFTALASLSGQPAVSVPCGLGDSGLPIGLQLLGRPGCEEVLLGLAGRVERTAGARAAAAARSAGAAGLTPGDPFV